MLIFVSPHTNNMPLTSWYIVYLVVSCCTAGSMPFCSSRRLLVPAPNQACGCLHPLILLTAALRIYAATTRRGAQTNCSHNLSPPNVLCLVCRDAQEGWNRSTLSCQRDSAPLPHFCYKPTRHSLSFRHLGGN